MSERLRSQTIRPIAVAAEAWNQDRVAALREAMRDASRIGPSQLREVLPADVLLSILQSSWQLLKAEPVLLEVDVDPEAEVVMVGDTHGQFHDVIHMMEKVGAPSEQRIYIFNGDYVDRGAWGLEVLTLLLTLKLACPRFVHLIRGNHEGALCTRYYGFMTEIKAKYPRRHGELYGATKRVFAHLPLAAVVKGVTLILHGGLFRKPPTQAAKPHRAGRKRRKVSAAAAAAASPATTVDEPEVPVIGSLADLRAASKGGLDPDGHGHTLVAADVTWSDPVREPGFTCNESRNIGIVFGPDVTQSFLESNGLKLILRSHEGPDARDSRDDMPQVLEGWSLDHDTPAGRLYTVFSAPDYPQFQLGDTRYNNQGAVAVLTGPGWHTPRMITYGAALPRPQVEPYYELADMADTDGHDELLGSDDGPSSASGVSSGTGGGTDAGMASALTDAATTAGECTSAATQHGEASCGSGGGGGLEGSGTVVSGNGDAAAPMETAGASGDAAAAFTTGPAAGAAADVAAAAADDGGGCAACASDGAAVMSDSLAPADAVPCSSSLAGGPLQHSDGGAQAHVGDSAGGTSGLQAPDGEGVAVPEAGACGVLAAALLDAVAGASGGLPSEGDMA